MLIYNLFLVLYRFGVWVSSLSNPKAKLWISGRKDWRLRIGTTLSHSGKRIWIHCSSLGEFEQGKPLIESLKKHYPNYKVILTFFSPSGYEGCKNYDQADHIFYLPMDSKRAAKDFVAAVKPSMAIFVKYEFWHYYLHELKKKQVPTLLVAAAFRPEQVFFKWYGGFFQKMLHCFTQIHVQDGISAKLLHAIGLKDNLYITGDTRYDRVAAISAGIRPIPEAEKFKGAHNLLIAGSTWPDDEILLQQCMATLPADWKVIIAPHEVDSKHIEQVLKLFGNNTALFSELPINSEAYAKRVLIVDNIGMLSSLYAYGDIAYVGGGFQKGGIHNTLEPAVFGLPVIMGPIYKKFVEAVSLVSAKAAFPVNNVAEAKTIIDSLVDDTAYRQSIQEILKKFMKKKTGAAERILSEISKSELLKTI